MVLTHLLKIFINAKKNRGYPHGRPLRLGKFAGGMVGGLPRLGNVYYYESVRNMVL